jgi:hypothetical protein
VWEWEENKFSMCSSSKSTSSPCNNGKEGETMDSKTTECMSNLPIRKIGRLNQEKQRAGCFLYMNNNNFIKRRKFLVHEEYTREPKL